MKPAYLITPQSVVVHLKEQSFTLQRGSQKADTVIKLIKEQKWIELEDFLAPGQAIPKMTGGLFTVGTDGQLYAINDETPIHKAIAKKLLAFVQEGLPCEALMAFWNNLKQNPSQRSIEQLYGFLEANHHPLTDDGCFLAYKKVTNVGNGKFKDSHSRTMDNNIGDIVKMAREKVNPDPQQTCSHGLHVAAFEYANGFSGDVLVTVKVNPRDVVAVPVDYNQQKMRVCQYEVVEVYGQKQEMKEHLVKGHKKEAPIQMPQVVSKSNKKEVYLTGLTARLIIKLVSTELKNKTLNNANLKNKQSIFNKAKKLFEAAGWSVK